MINKYSILRRGSAVAAGLLFFSATFACLAAETMVLKMSIIVPEKTVWGKHFKAMSEEIKKQTNGAVALKVYYGGVQGDEINVIQKMRIGQLHGAGLMAYGLTKVCPDSLAFAIPLQFRSDEEVVWVHERMDDYLKEQARSKGFEVVGWTNQGYTYCYSGNKISDLSSLRQAKPWMLENDEFCKAFFKCASISAIPVEVGDVLTALQSGLIRTVFAPPTAMILMQWHTRVKHQLDLGIFYSFGAVVFAKDQWDKIAKPNQEIITKIVRSHITELNADVEKQNKDASKVLGERLDVVKPSREAVEEFRGVTEKVEKEMVGKDFSAEALRLLKSYLAEYRSGAGARDGATQK